MRTLARNALRTCISPQQIYGVVRYPENSYFGIFSRQPIGSPYGSLCIRGLRRIRSPPVGVTTVIERKRRPTSKNTQQPNQSPKEQVQKSNTSHAEEACRLRAGRRAVLRAGSAPFSAPGARRSARRERASARRERAVQRAGSAPFCAPEDARAARRETCRGAPCARRVRAACARGAGRSGLSLLARVSQSSAVGPRAGGGTPGVAPRCAGRPPHT